MNIALVPSNKSKEKLIIDGFTYHIEKKETNFIWCCANRKTEFCKGRVVTQLIDGEHVVRKGPSAHSHAPVAFHKNMCIVNSKIKNAAKSSALKPSQIIRDSIVECEANCRVYLPKKEAQKKDISH